MKLPVYTIGLLLTGCFASCSSNSQTKLIMDKKIIVEDGKTVNIKEAGVSITNNGCGREWGDFGERAYYHVRVKKGDSTYNMPERFQPLYIGELQLKVDKANVWHNMEDSVPPGACRIHIQRSPAFILLEKYGWTPKVLLDNSKFELPEKLTGIPFYHYASATLAAGYDLDQLAGQTVTLLKIKLAETGKRSGHNVWAHIIMENGEALTGWLSSQDMAPGIAALNIPKERFSAW
jgi:hypothetical protein